MNDVLAYWFDELQPSQHFKRSEQIDATIAERFTDTHRRVVAGETESWRDTAEGRLAEIIVLDQFSRNLFRDDGRAFAADPQALTLAQELVRRGQDRTLPEAHRAFAYMPYMHSESLAVHDRAMQLFAGLPENLEFERRHRAVIERFGRYPHRNAALGRTSSDEEREWMKTNKGF